MCAVRLVPNDCYCVYISWGVWYSVRYMYDLYIALIQFVLGADHDFQALGSADFEHHVQRRTRCAAMVGTFERTDRAGDRGNDIGSRGDDNPCRKGGRVETVVAHGIEIRF